PSVYPTASHPPSLLPSCPTRRSSDLLARVTTRGFQVDHRYRREAREVADGGILALGGPVAPLGERAHRQGVGVARQHPRRLDDVLDGGAVHHGVEFGLDRPAPLAGLQRERVTAVEEHRCFHRRTSAQRWVEEHHRQHLALEAAGHLAALDPRGKLQQPVDRVDRPVLHREEVAAAQVSTLASASSSSRASSVVNDSGGSSRSVSGWVAVPVSTRCCHSSRWTWAAGRSSSSPIRKPRPCTARTAGIRAASAISIALTLRVLASRSSLLITSSVASAAAHGTGPPPNVEPRSPIRMSSTSEPAASTAAIGRPLASPLAIDSASGTTPKDSAAVK